jgi:hypothetical protein
MNQNALKFSELPDFIRIKLSESGKKEFWHRIDEFGGIKNFCEAFEYSTSTVYNWKNKDSFIPVELIRNVFGIEAADDVVAMKGEGRSRPIQNPEFPLSPSDELLTRIQTSVNVNSNGIPVYQSSDQGNVKRFAELLNQIGDVPVEVYNRSVYELRYPKYLNQVLSIIEYSEDFAALVDEKGKVEDRRLVAEDSELRVEEFEGQLYSRDKALQLALARNNKQKIQQIMADEADKVRNALNQN